MAFTDNYLNRFGNDGLKCKNIGDIVFDRYSLGTGSVIWECASNRFAQALADFAYGAPHPIATWLGLEGVRCTFSPTYVQFNAQYAGIPTATTAPIYALDFGVGQEPVETHVDFADFGTEANGAIIVDNQFEGFGMDAPDELRGTTSYLDANQGTWTKTWCSTSRPTGLNKVGRIDNPEGSPPNLPGQSNWLCMGLSFTQRGKAYVNRMEWKASGRKGWSQIIYG